MLSWIFRRRYNLTDEESKRYGHQRKTITLDGYLHILGLHTHGRWSCLRAPIQGHNTAWLVIFPVVRFHVSCNNPEQFAEPVYSAVPVKLLIENHTTLSRPNYPLEKYDAVRDCIFIDAFRGTCADLPAFIVFRPISQQLVVSISGSASIVHMLYNLRFRITAHPSGLGQVHTGFLQLYEGIKKMLFDVYLFMVELLAQEDPILSGLKLRICTFGSPRIGDSVLVNYFLALVQSFRENLVKMPLENTQSKDIMMVCQVTSAYSRHLTALVFDCTH